MRSHFKQVSSIRAAVIAGKIDDAIEPARVIVEMQGVDTLPKVWRSSVKELQAASARIRQSPDLPEAAAATADIGMTCGGCHVELTGPTVDVAAPPSASATVAERMRRHLWGTERLWEGLYGPSDDAWAAGAQALASEPFSKDELGAGDVLAKSLAERIVTLGKKATTTKQGEERAKIYAEVLATCAPCHARSRSEK
jgi:cytochrome c553